MAGNLLLSSTRLSQPTLGALDLAHPLVRGLDVLFAGNRYYRPRAVITGTPAVASGSPAFGVSRHGMGAQFSGGAQAFTLDAVSAAGLTGNEAFTIEVLCAVTSVPNLSGFFGAPQIGAADARGLIATGGVNNRNIYFWGGSADLASGVDWLTDGSVQHVFVTTAGPSTTMRFYRGGVQIASGTTPALGSRSSSGNWRLGDMAIGWAASPTGVIFKAAFYLRELSAAEIASLTAAPWQQFGDDEIVIQIAAASSSVFNPLTGRGGSAAQILMAH